MIPDTRRPSAAQAEALQRAANGLTISFSAWSVVAALHRRGLIAGWARTQHGYRLQLTPAGKELQAKGEVCS